MSETTRKNIYVDNVITGTQSFQEAVHLYNVSKQIFKGTAMNLQDWMTNSQEVLNEIPVHDRANRENMNLGAWINMVCQRGLFSFYQPDQR